jgi:hypothetical protein
MVLLRGLVLPEYSIEWLTCAIASRLDAVMVGCRVLLKIVYLLTCRVLGVAVRPGASQPVSPISGTVVIYCLLC